MTGKLNHRLNELKYNNKKKNDEETFNLLLE